MQQALDEVKSVHARKITDYKRLLEQSQASSASQLHALQAELRLLRLALENERAAVRESEMERDHMRMTAFASRTARKENDGTIDLAAALRGDGNGVFNETEVKKAIRSLKLRDRMRL